MIKVEYLVFIDSKNVKCVDIPSFEHLIQSDPDIEINKDKMLFKKSFKANYSIHSNKIAETDKVYFHLKFSVSKTSEIEKLTELLRNVKAVFSIITKAPQTLFDGISQHYATGIYPQIYEIENLMRKLITKFMLINVGADWTNEYVPDDVKNSVNQDNKDSTYLHNVDFIQLKNFLFSEKYTVSKDNLIKKLKGSKDLSELDLGELKQMIPISNWERYFTNEIQISQEQLSKKWSELYDLRCKVAHNKTFTKSDFKRVSELIADLKPTIEKAIEKLDSIDISKIDRDNLREEVVGNFSPAFGNFISHWRELTDVMYETVEAKVRQHNPEMIEEPRNFNADLSLLRKLQYFDEETYFTIKRLQRIRNKVAHFDETISDDRVESGLNQLKETIEKMKGWL
jgi:hypothetical protein